MPTLEENLDQASTEDSRANSTSYQQLSFLQRICLGAGGITDSGMQTVLTGMAIPIFNVYLGVNPVLIGVAMSLPRFMEMIIDPWIGGLSDRTRGRWGRRHPYMVVGGLAGPIIFCLAWWVPTDWSVEAKGYWLIAFTLLHFAAYSLFIVPFSALLAEVSVDPIVRTRVIATKTALSAIAGGVMGWLYWLCQRKGFSDPLHGMRIVSLGFGLMMAVCAIVPTLVCKRSRKFHSSVREPKAKNEWKTIWEILRIAEFRGILLALFSLVTAFSMVGNLGFYINLYFIFGGNTEATASFGGICSIVGCGTGILFCYIVGVLAKRWGTWRTLFTLMSLEFLAHISYWWTARPEWPYASLASALVINLGLTSFWIFMPSLTGEITNRYEQQTGRSLYGSFSAIFGVSQKIAGSVSVLLTGFILNFTGFQSTLGAHQPAYTLTRMRILNSLVPACGLVMTIVFLLYTKSKANKPLGSVPVTSS